MARITNTLRKSVERAMELYLDKAVESGSNKLLSAGVGRGIHPVKLHLMVLSILKRSLAEHTTLLRKYR